MIGGGVGEKAKGGRGFASKVGCSDISILGYRLVVVTTGDDEHEKGGWMDIYVIITCVCVCVCVTTQPFRGKKTQQ